VALAALNGVGAELGLPGSPLSVARSAFNVAQRPRDAGNASGDVTDFGRDGALAARKLTVSSDVVFRRGCGPAEPS
jgi:hypothetical protein